MTVIIAVVLCLVIIALVDWLLPVVEVHTDDSDMHFTHEEGEPE